MNQRQTIVITGSTRGIGLGLARAFAERGHQVVISGRRQAAVDQVLADFDAGLAQGQGKLYNFEGFGSDGMQNPGLTVYGATKRALRYFTESVAREYRDSGVLIGALSPGMVPTDLLIYSSRSQDPVQWEKSRRIMNILGDKVETVAPWLAEQALANQRQGARIEWLTRRKALWRFLSPAYRKRRLVEEYEAGLKQPIGPEGRQ